MSTCELFVSRLSVDGTSPAVPQHPPTKQATPRPATSHSPRLPRQHLREGAVVARPAEYQGRPWSSAGTS